MMIIARARTLTPYLGLALALALLSGCGDAAAEAEPLDQQSTESAAATEDTASDATASDAAVDSDDTGSTEETADPAAADEASAGVPLPDDLPDGLPIPDGATVTDVITINGTIVYATVVGNEFDTIADQTEAWVDSAGWTLDIDGDFESTDGLAYFSRSYLKDDAKLTFNFNEEADGTISWGINY